MSNNVHTRSNYISLMHYSCNKKTLLFNRHCSYINVIYNFFFCTTMYQRPIIFDGCQIYYMVPTHGDNYINNLKHIIIQILIEKSCIIITNIYILSNIGNNMILELLYRCKNHSTYNTDIDFLNNIFTKRKLLKTNCI